MPCRHCKKRLKLKPLLYGRGFTIAVPGTGFEPAHPFERCHLKAVRLPISPPGQGEQIYIKKDKPYADTLKSLSASLRLVFLSVLSFLLPIISAQLTLYSPAGNFFK